MANVNVEKWLKTAMALKPHEIKPCTVPVRVQVIEADQVVRFYERYWDANDGRPGLQSAEQFLPMDLIVNIRSLTDACQYLQAQASFGDEEATAQAAHADAMIERAHTVAAELGASLEFVLNDQENTASDVALRVMAERAASSHSVSQLAETMADYALLARREEARLLKFKGFDKTLIDDAEQLAKSLLALMHPVGAPASPAVELRDRMLCLLAPLVSEARRIARFVFRHYPNLQRQIASAYRRERRAASRGKADPANDTSPAVDD